MKTKLMNLFLVLAIFIFTNSCDRPDCNNTNPTFNGFTLDAKEYKSELARQIQSIGAENLSYWFDKYQMRDGKEFIIIHIQGEDLCAKGEIQVTDWGKIIGMRRVRSGYRGAELRGLKIKIKQDSTGTNFVYDNVDRIID